MILRSPYRKRSQFLALPASLGCRSGVEVGTHLAWFAVDILGTCPDMSLTCIDPWAGEFYPRVDPEQRYRTALDNLAPYAHRVRVLRAKSLDVVGQFPDGCFDFVFLDALHRYAYPDGSGIAADLRAWWPKVAHGGVFAGHDHHDRHGCGVVQACTEFFGELGRDYYVTTREWHPTWYVVK